MNKITKKQVKISFKLDGEHLAFFADNAEKANILLAALKEKYPDALTGIKIEEVEV